MVKKKVCFADDQREFVRMLLEIKIKQVKDELEDELELLEQSGFYDRKMVKIKKVELRKAERLLKGIDKFPGCR